MEFETWSKDSPSITLPLCHTLLHPCERLEWLCQYRNGTPVPPPLPMCHETHYRRRDYTFPQQPWHFQGRRHDDKIILEMRYHPSPLSPFLFFWLLSSLFIWVFYSALVFALLSLSCTLLQFTSNFLPQYFTFLSLLLLTPLSVTSFLCGFWKLPVLSFRLRNTNRLQPIKANCAHPTHLSVLLFLSSLFPSYLT